MGTEEQKAQWRLRSNKYYQKYSKTITLWKEIKRKAKKRGIQIPKLTKGDLNKHTPMDLVQQFRLPPDLISPRQLNNYKNGTSTLIYEPSKIPAKKIPVQINPAGCICNLDEQGKCNDDVYLCKCGCKEKHGV